MWFLDHMKLEFILCQLKLLISFVVTSISASHICCCGWIGTMRYCIVNSTAVLHHVLLQVLLYMFLLLCTSEEQSVIWMMSINPSISLIGSGKHEQPDWYSMLQQSNWLIICYGNPIGWYYGTFNSSLMRTTLPQKLCLQSFVAFR